MKAQLKETPLAGACPLISEWLTGAPWWRFKNPFPHIVAHNVLRPEVYLELSKAFDARLASLVRERRAQHGGTDVRWYDAEIISFGRDDIGNVPVMLDAEWHRLLASVLDIHATTDIDAGIHHHHPGSKSGWVHNDLNPGWFSSDESEQVNLSDRSKCDYRHGTAYVDDIRPVQRIRAATMIFFINNGPWTVEDGGETGLYESVCQPVHLPTKRVLPLDNSLLLFECSPHSFHSFLTNAVKPRNSIILWLHRELSRSQMLWGSKHVVYWP